MAHFELTDKHVDLPTVLPVQEDEALPSLQRVEPAVALVSVALEELGNGCGGPSGGDEIEITVRTLECRRRQHGSPEADRDAAQEPERHAFRL
jgi:hypothetical protein